VERDSILKKILEEEDFIHSPKHQNSLNKFLAKQENLLENGTIGRVLLIPEEEVERLYQESVIMLRKEMGEDEDDIEDR
jgi:hypothetical protein